MSTLFRQQAIDNQRQNLWGNTLLIQPIAFKWLTLFLLLIVSSLIAYLIFNDYSRKETVRGYLVPDRGIVKVYASRNGIYSNIAIKEGAFVKEGQLLFTVNTEQQAREGDVNQLMQVKLDEQISKLSTQIELFSQQQAARKQQLTVAIQNIDQGLQQLDRQLSLQQDLLALQKQRRTNYEKLMAKGMVARAELTRLEEEKLLQQQKLSDLESLLLRRQQDRQQLKSELQGLPTVTAQRVAELEATAASLQQRRIEIAGRTNYQILAPVSGRIVYLQAAAGKAATPQLPALTILPEGTELHAELYIPSRAIGFVESGMSVKLRYDAYPYQRFGSHDGKVENYSQTVLDPREISVPLVIEEPVYRVSVALTRQQIIAYGKQLLLQPGLTLEADVILEKRSLFEWLLEPLYSLKGRV